MSHVYFVLVYYPPPPQMYVYASYYYRRATTLRPGDSRMWCALGSVYEQLGDRRDEAIACYQRAASVGEGREVMADLRLARLYRSGGDVETACTHYAAFVEGRERSDGAVGVSGAAASDLAEALLFLARTALAEGHTTAAGLYAGRVLPMPIAHEVEAARALLTDIRRAAAAAEAAADADAAANASVMSTSKLFGGSTSSLGYVGARGDVEAPASPPSGLLLHHTAHSAAAAGGRGGQLYEYESETTSAPRPRGEGAGVDGSWGWAGGSAVAAGHPPQQQLIPSPGGGEGGDDDGMAIDTSG